MNICLIPARIGSKRIKKKNIKKFYGKPLISYAILNAKKSKLFKKIIVSTDSKSIARIAIRYGAEVPFLRPKKFSNDKATDIEVRKHFFSFSLNTQSQSASSNLVLVRGALQRIEDCVTVTQVLGFKVILFLLIVTWNVRRIERNNTWQVAVRILSLPRTGGAVL